MQPDWRDRNGNGPGPGAKAMNWRCREADPAAGRAAKRLKSETNAKKLKAETTASTKQPSVEALAWRQRGRAGDLDDAAEADAPPCNWRDRGEKEEMGLEEEEMGLQGLKQAMDLDLAVVELRAGNAEPMPDEKLSEFAINGISKDRLINLKRSGKCSCKNQCVKNFNIPMATKLCGSFWRLRKADQDMAIYTMYAAIHPPKPATATSSSAQAASAEQGDGLALAEKVQGAGPRTAWKLGSQPVCFEAFYKIMALGKQRLRKMTQGLVDRRSLGTTVTAKEAKQRALCDRFFAEHYRSTAEPMPHEYTGDGLDADGVANSPLLGTFERSLVDLLPEFLKDVADVGLPVRYLQHARLHDLYWLFVATVGVWLKANEAVPSWSVFWRCWNNRWSSILLFRKSSTHSQCTFCWKCQQWLAKHISLSDKLTIAQRLREHLRMQYADRCLYWSLRWASQRGNLNLLTVIIDSMDKSKFGLPQWPHGQKPKLVDELVRPTLTLTGCIAHGCATCLFLADETVSHGADAFLEVLLLTLDHALKVHQLEGKPFPQHLVIQSDNPTNQAKNSLTNVFLAVLVAKYKFHTCTLNFLTVGHTHEDIDQLFGIVTELLRRSASFQCPADVKKLLQDGLENHISMKGEKLYVEKLDCVRDFSAWLGPLGTELHNAFQTRKGIVAPHSFYFKRRQDLFDDEAKQLSLQRSADFSSHPLDVFVMVKQFMHSKELQQPPLLCIPLTFLNRLNTQLPANLKPRHVVDDDRKRKLGKFAGIFRNRAQGVTFQNAASYYEELASGGPMNLAVPESTVLSSLVRNNALCEPTNNAEFPHLPATSWELKVRFKP